MRFYFTDAERPRRIAKRLKKALEGHGIQLPLHACQQIVAEACGYPGFHEAEASAGKAGKSEFDENVSPETVVAREAQQHAALVRAGIPPETAASVAAEVGFTASWSRGGTVPSKPIEAAARPSRTERVRNHMGGHGIRVGNGDRAVLKSLDGGFLGLVLGKDGAAEHLDEPEGILEALGVTEDAETVSQSTATKLPVWKGYFGFLDERSAGDDRATVLAVNDLYATSMKYKKYRLRRKDFAAADDYTWWHAQTGTGPDEILTAWSYHGFLLAGWDEVARDRIAMIHEALVAGRLGVALSHNGPMLLLADRFDPDWPIEAVVLQASHGRRSIKARGSHWIAPDVLVATRESEVEATIPPEKPTDHEFTLPDGSKASVPRDSDASPGFEGTFCMADGSVRPLKVYCHKERMFAALLPGTSEPIDDEAATLQQAGKDIANPPSAIAPERALRFAELVRAGEAFVAGDKLLFPCPSPVWRICVENGRVVGTLTLAGTRGLSEQPETAVPAGLSNDAGKVGKEIATRLGGLPMNQVGQLDYSNPFSETVNTTLAGAVHLALSDDAPFAGWADEGLAGDAKNAGRRLLAAFRADGGRRAAKDGETSQAARSFYDACKMASEAAAESEEASPGRLFVDAFIKAMDESIRSEARYAELVAESAMNP